MRGNGSASLCAVGELVEAEGIPFGHPNGFEHHGRRSHAPCTAQARSSLADVARSRTDAEPEPSRMPDVTHRSCLITRRSFPSRIAIPNCFSGKSNSQFTLERDSLAGAIPIIRFVLKRRMICLSEMLR
jgi:hypothetical protein